MHNRRYEAIEVERQNGVGWITLNRPKSINAINNSMRQELPDALHALDADADIAVICLHGAGSRGFCAGADLKEDTPVPVSAEPAPRINWIRSLDQVGKPLIAAIHGYCLGGGLEIALACDIRIAAQDAVLGLPETRIGLIPGGGGTQRLARLIGLGPALDMLLTGERLDADTAYKRGIVTRLFPPDRYLENAKSFANELAGRPLTALQLAKRAAKEGSEMNLADGLQLEHELFTQLLAAGRKKTLPLRLPGS